MPDISIEWGENKAGCCLLHVDDEVVGHVAEDELSSNGAWKAVLYVPQEVVEILPNQKEAKEWLENYISDPIRMWIIQWQSQK